MADFTLVSGQVLDPQELPYSNGTLVATLNISGTPQFIDSGGLYSLPGQATELDAEGRFVIQLADVNALTPSGATWNFHVCSAQGTIQPGSPITAGPVCFDVFGIFITGAAMDLTNILHAAAKPLANLPTSSGPPGSGTVGPGTPGQFAVYTGSTAIAGSPQLDYSLTTPSKITAAAPLVVPVLDFPPGDTGISRSQANVIAVGNGTAGDISGSVRAAAFLLGGTNAFTALVDFNFAVANQIGLASPVVIAWSSTTATAGNKDLGISRIGANLLAIGNGTPGSITASILCNGVLIGGNSSFTATLDLGFQVTGSIILPSTGMVAWTSTAGVGSARTAGLSNINGILAVGNGTQGDFSGRFAASQYFVGGSDLSTNITLFTPGVLSINALFAAATGSLALQDLILGPNSQITWAPSIGGTADLGLSRVLSDIFGDGSNIFTGLNVSGVFGDFSGYLFAVGILLGGGATTSTATMSLNDFGVTIQTRGQIRWTSSNNLPVGSEDVGLGRIAPGTLSVTDGSTNPNSRAGSLQLTDIHIFGRLFDSTAAAGTPILNSTGTGTQWVAAAGGAPVNSTAIIVQDNLDQNLRNIDTTGIITTLVLTSTDPIYLAHAPAAPNQFTETGDYCKDAAGNIFNWAGNIGCIFKINTSNQITTILGNGTAGGLSGIGGPASAANIPGLTSMVCDRAGNLYFKTRAVNSVVPGQGVPVVICGINMQSTPTVMLGVTVPAGYIELLVGSFTAQPNEVAPNDVNGLATWISYGSNFSGAGDLSVDGSGNLYFGDFVYMQPGNPGPPATSGWSSCGVRRVDAVTGSVTLIAGNQTTIPITAPQPSPVTGPAFQSYMSGKVNVSQCCDQAGNVFFLENFNTAGLQSGWQVAVLNNQSTTQIFFGVSVAPGNVEVVAGSGVNNSVSPGQFVIPDGPALDARMFAETEGIYCDAAGNLYLGVYIFPVILEIFASNATLARVGGIYAEQGGSSADAIPATTASLNGFGAGGGIMGLSLFAPLAAAARGPTKKGMTKWKLPKL